MRRGEVVASARLRVRQRGLKCVFERRCRKMVFLKQSSGHRLAYRNVRTGNLDKNADAMEKRQFARCRDIIAGWIFFGETYLLCTLAGTGVVMRCTFLAVLLSCRCV